MTTPESKTDATGHPPVSSSELLAAVVRRHYNRIDNPTGVDGAQMWNGEWWMPLWGCDTLDNMIDDLTYVVEKLKAANDKTEPTEGGKK